MKFASFQWMCHVTSWEGKLAFPSISRPLPLNPRCLCLQQLCSPRFHAMSFNHLWHMAYPVQSRYCLGQKLLHSYYHLWIWVNYESMTMIIHAILLALKIISRMLHPYLRCFQQGWPLTWWTRCTTSSLAHCTRYSTGSFPEGSPRGPAPVEILVF